MYESVQRKVAANTAQQKVYRDEVRASKRYTFFNVEFREIAYFYLLFCRYFFVPESGQDIG